MAVVTVDPGMPEAQAVAVKDGRILMVGTDDEIRQYHVGATTEVIDLEGQLAVADEHQVVFGSFQVHIPLLVAILGNGFPAPGSRPTSGGGRQGQSEE